VCDELALARRERPVNDCEIEEYQIWKRVGFDAMTSRRTGRRTRICYVESGPKLVGNEAPGLWAVGAMPDEVHNYKEAFHKVTEVTPALISIETMPRADPHHRQRLIRFAPAACHTGARTNPRAQHQGFLDSRMHS